MNPLGEPGFWNGHRRVQRGVAPTTLPGPMARPPVPLNGGQWVQQRAAPPTPPVGPMDHVPAFWNGYEWVQRRGAPTIASNVISTVSEKLGITIV
jgi:hypothetical protein